MFKKFQSSSDKKIYLKNLIDKTSIVLILLEKELNKLGESTEYLFLEKEIKKYDWSNEKLSFLEKLDTKDDLTEYSLDMLDKDLISNFFNTLDLLSFLKIKNNRKIILNNKWT